MICLNLCADAWNRSELMSWQSMAGSVNSPGCASLSDMGTRLYFLLSPQDFFPRSGKAKKSVKKVVYIASSLISLVDLSIYNPTKLLRTMSEPPGGSQSSRTNLRPTPGRTLRPRNNDDHHAIPEGQPDIPTLTTALHDLAQMAGTLDQFREGIHAFAYVIFSVYESLSQQRHSEQLESVKEFFTKTKEALPRVSRNGRSQVNLQPAKDRTPMYRHCCHKQRQPDRAVVLLSVANRMQDFLP